MLFNKENKERKRTGQAVGMARMKYLQETNMENRTPAWLFGLYKKFLMQQYILHSIHIDIKQITVTYKNQ